MNDLHAQWRHAWTRAALPEPPRTVFDALCEAYAEPQRRYHTTQHLRECLAQADEVERLAEHPGEVLLALWFHDAVYDPQSRGNEARSADWARDTLACAGGREAAERVHRLVMATEHHAVPDTPDTRVLVDVDLSILGAEPDRFDEYERQVREEYRHVPGFVFRPKRRAVLEGFLARAAIFNTDDYVRRLEAKARTNLRRSIDRLRG